MASSTVKILLVEDDEEDALIIRELLSVTHKARFQIFWSSTYEEGVTQILRNSFDVALIDYDLGRNNGLELIQEVTRKGIRTPMIMVTGQGDYEVDLEAMQAGAVDFISKRELKSTSLERAIRYAIERKRGDEKVAFHLQKISELFEELQRSNQQLALSYDETIKGWSRALDLRDHETYGHSERVTLYTVHLARQLGIPHAEIGHIQRGALLHDIGKMAIPDAILQKAGPLDEKEWVVMRQHPTFAYELLSPIPYLQPALDIPFCHHERLDGSGYPRGLKGEEIPVAARLFAVVDVWDAMCSDRPYRAAISEEKAAEYLTLQVGIKFDPKMVQIFLQLVDSDFE